VVDFGPAKTLAIPTNQDANSRSGAFLSREIRALRFQRELATDRLSEAQDTALFGSVGPSR
jgi:hypothetical protein